MIDAIGSTAAKVVVVQDFPTDSQYLFGGIKEGFEYITFQSLMAEAGFDTETLTHMIAYYDYETAAPTKGKATKKKAPKASEKARYKAYVHAIVDHCKPAVVLLCGAEAIRLLCGNKVSYEKKRGCVVPYTTPDGTSVLLMPVYGLDRLYNEPEIRQVFVHDVSYAKRRIDGIAPPDRWPTKVVRTTESVEAMLKDLSEHKAVSFDIETTGLDSTKGKVLMLGFAREGQRYVMPLYSKRMDLVPLETLTKKQEMLNEFFSTYEGELIAQNGKFDNRWLNERKVKSRTTFDTYIAAYLLRNNVPHDLKWLSKAMLGAWDYNDDIVFKEALTVAELNAMMLYCADDVQYTLMLYEVLQKALKKNPSINRVFRNIVMPADAVLQKVELDGAYVDRKGLEIVRTTYTAKREELYAKLASFLPEGEYNFGSSTQVAEILYTTLGLPIYEWTPAGKPSAGKSALKKLARDHEFPKLLLEYRKYDKAIVGFIDAWGDYLGPDSRMHTTYNIARTATGRLSASEPNLQQVPRDGNIRSLVCAEPGAWLIEADMSQVELRVISVEADETNMKQVYHEGGDIHTATGCQLTGKTPETLLKEERSRAKPVNFGYVFKMFPKSFMEYAFVNYDTVFTLDEATQARDRFFEKYPAILKYHERQEELVKKQKYVRTGTGRVRRLENIDSPDKFIRSQAERQAINTPVQSLASDMTMIAMVLVDEYLEEHGYRARIIGQVHDAIMVESFEKKSVTANIAENVKRLMESTREILIETYGYQFDIPVVADVAVGKAWGKTVEISEFLADEKKFPEKA